MRKVDAKIIGILIFVFFIFPVAADNFIVGLYNAGELFIDFNNTSTSSLHVDGDLEAGADNALMRTGNIYMRDDAKFSLTGDLIQNRFAAVENGIFVLTESSTAKVEFNGSAAQTIKTGNASSELPDKEMNCIHFPDLWVNNSAHVRLSPEIAAKTNHIELLKGWLIVDSKSTGANSSELAHLYVRGRVNYPAFDASVSAAERVAVLHVNVDYNFFFRLSHNK